MAAADGRGNSSSHIPIHYANKAPDGERSTITIQQDGTGRVIGMGHSSLNVPCNLELC